MNSTNHHWSLYSLITSLDEDVKEKLLERVLVVYGDARKMTNNVIQHGETAKVFDREFCEEIAQTLPSHSFEILAKNHNVQVFDIVSAYCDYLMAVRSSDLALNVGLLSAMEEENLTLSDVFDFAIRILTDGQTTATSIFMEDFWCPTQMLLLCTIIRLGLFESTIIDELDDDCLVIRHKKHIYNTDQTWKDVTKSVEKSLSKHHQLEAHTLDSIETIDSRIQNQFIPRCEQIREELQSNLSAIRTIASDFLAELNKVNIGLPELDQIPDLELVGNNNYENMSRLKKMCEYQLCDHLEIGFGKRMNVNKQDELIVEIDNEFVDASFVSWKHDDETQMTVSIKNGNRKYTKKVNADKVAMGVMPEVMCSAGTRVLAEYHENYGISKPKICYWSWGTLGTFAIKEYSYHYLVFFDHGGVRFVRPPNIRLCVLQPNDPENDNFNPVFVYQHVKGVRREFLRDYFKLYPSWPIMKVDPETTEVNFSVVKDLNRKKRTVRPMLLKKDRCLLLVRYLNNTTDGNCHLLPCPEHEHEDEWIFAGDCQRIPALNNIINKGEPREIADYPKQLQPYIQMLYPKYENECKEFDDGYLLLEQFKIKNTARKNTRKETAFFDFFNNARNMRLQFDDVLKPNAKFKRKRIQSKLTKQWFDFPDWSKLPKSTHECCSPDCLSSIKKEHLLNVPVYKNCSPLFRPFLFGFNRIFISTTCGRVPSLSQLKREVTEDLLYVYEAPCGRLLRNGAEVAFYLHLTKCDQISVEQFTFRSWERVNLVYKSDERTLICQDYSGTREAVDIPIVNSIDNEGIPSMIYQSRRFMDEPLLERQMEFLSCCSCDDDCLDASKCACQQLTAETHQRLDERIRRNTPDGYILRRLENKLFTGIYECNSLCGCRRNCMNRVVQRDISIPLQMFKTENKGWGVRTLVDLPAGLFVSTYSGKMYTDVKADEYVRNGQGNDMYFADVDLFDSVENMKLGLDIPFVDEGIDVNDQPQRSARKKRTKKKHKKQPQQSTSKDVTLLRQIFDEESLFVVDAQDRGNIGRFFNHSCDPNLEVQMVFHETHDLRLPLIAFFTLSDVEAGTELCWNYGYVAGSVSGKAIDCCCGSAICVGRIL
ncbi:hypothetical protein M3Y95_00005500 [Aphelenchoides besseyi]|nr:hypothetical protein M3Y95_00005500 [Aphelenchoides besseyi]